MDLLAADLRVISNMYEPPAAADPAMSDGKSGQSTEGAERAVASSRDTPVNETRLWALGVFGWGRVYFF